MANQQINWHPDYRRACQTDQNHLIADHWERGLSCQESARILGNDRATISNHRSAIRARALILRPGQSIQPAGERSHRKVDIDAVMRATAGMSWHRELA